jgi:hypothetical protein
MRHRPIPLIVLVAGSVLSLATAVQAVGAADADPRAFLAGLYAHYPVAGKAHPFDPVGPQVSRVFDAPLAALIRRDQRNARNEVGALDGDPLCDCQDDAGMTWKIVNIVPQGAGRALAQVRLTFPDTPRPRIDDLRVDLVRTPAGWRIHDIASSDTPSLRGLFGPAARRIKP